MMLIPKWGNYPGDGGGGITLVIDKNSLREKPLSFFCWSTLVNIKELHMFGDLRWLGIMFLLFLVTGTSIAQDPAQQQQVKVWTGSFGAGLALTGGNSDTLNFNLAFDAIRDPKTRNVMKFNGSFLRGEANDVVTVDRLGLSFRDDYLLTKRVFVFGGIDYLKDEFKLIDYWIAPTGGLGVKLVNTDAVKFNINGGVGVVWEKNPGFDADSSGAVSFGQDYSWQIVEGSRIFQNFSAVWEMDEFADALYHFGIGLATSVTANTELKVEFFDDFKNRPAFGAEKNDYALITSFSFKF